jgi:PTS system fructose-specific IIC component
MKIISDILTQDHIILDLNVNDKFRIISKLLKTLESCSEVIDIDKFAEDIERREKDFPTGLENGTALPHARTTAVSDLVMAFGRCVDGIDFGAPDGNPSHLIFLFGVPRDEVKDYLKTIAQLSRLLKQDTFRDQLLNANTSEDVITAISEAEKNLS